MVCFNDCRLTSSSFPGLAGGGPFLTGCWGAGEVFLAAPALLLLLPNSPPNRPPAPPLLLPLLLEEAGLA